MDKIIEISGTKIQTRWLNYAFLEQQKPIVIFLHEALGSIQQWRTFPQLLCDRLNFVGLIIERSGHGGSSELKFPRTKTYLHDYSNETKAVLNELIPTNYPIYIVGHSDGGTIALLFSIQSKFNIQKVVTMAAHTFVENETLKGIPPAIQAFETGKLNGLFKIHGPKTTTLFHAWSDTWLSADFRDWDIREEIKTISYPILAIQGEKDQYGTEKQVESIVCWSNHNKGLLIPNCGHHPHLEKTEFVIEQIEKWLK